MRNRLHRVIILKRLVIPAFFRTFAAYNHVII